jgi:hypothetical protein
MTYVYYIDGEKFTTDGYDNIPFDNISSPDEETPAYEDLSDGFKAWCLKGRILHRLTGPAYILRNGIEQYFLNGKDYDNVHDWIKDHPNPDLYFNAIGIFTETDKVLWFLQN